MIKNSLVLNSDSLIEIQAMKEDSVDCIITDPPYDFDKYMQRKLGHHMRRVCKGPIIIFCPPENQWDLGISKPPKYLFWIKPISTKNTSKNYSRFVEMILVWRGERCWNNERHWSQYTNVFNDLVEGSTDHPYEKPVSLIKRLMLNHTKPGQIVFDPFAGSGTVPYVAKMLKRKYVAIEQDKFHFANMKTRLS